MMLPRVWLVHKHYYVRTGFTLACVGVSLLWQMVCVTTHPSFPVVKYLLLAMSSASESSAGRKRYTVGEIKRVLKLWDDDFKDDRRGLQPTSHWDVSQGTLTDWKKRREEYLTCPADSQKAFAPVDGALLSQLRWHLHPQWSGSSNVGRCWVNMSRR